MTDEKTYENGIQDNQLKVLWKLLNDFKKESKANFTRVFDKFDSHTEQIVETRTQFRAARFWGLVFGAIVSFFVATGVSVAAIYFGQ